jgi:hypothetical protein
MIARVDLLKNEEIHSIMWNNTLLVSNPANIRAGPVVSRERIPKEI